MRYGPHELLVGPARKRPHIWRIVVGLVVIIATLYVFQQVLQSLLVGALSPDALVAFSESLRAGDTPAAVFVLVGGLGALGLGAAFAARWIHERPALSLIGPPGLALVQFAQVMTGLVLLYLAIAVLPPHGGLADLDPGLDLGLWLFLLPATTLAVLVQTASEEIVFRGYLQSQLAAWRDIPLLWIGLPSALFASAHYAPGMFGDNALIVVVWALAFGVLMADLTARSGTLGPAIAVHFANNFIAIALVATPGQLSGAALFVLGVGLDETDTVRAVLLQDLAVLGLCWLTARVALRR